jgi:putative ABC transport system ATP-binding protein
MDVSLTDVVVRIPPDQRLLFHVKSLRIDSGLRVLIHGASGIGKTTLLHLIAGLFLPDSGSVEVGGSNLCLLNDHQRSRLRREHLGIIFQRLNLIDHLDAIENVMLPLRDRRTARERAVNALKVVNMAGLLRERVANLSLGEQQRVAVGRVLAGKPALILADEPTSSLDERNAEAVMDALFDASEGSTLIVVSHDHRISRRFDRTIDFAVLISQ